MRARVPGRIGCPLGVCVLPEQPWNAPRTTAYPGYVHEILSHAGLCYDSLALDELADALGGLRILVTVGNCVLPDAAREAITAWIESGGAWLSVAGVCGLDALLGVSQQPPAYSAFGGGLGTLGEGYLLPEASHPAALQIVIPLHFFNGVTVKPTTAARLAVCLDSHQRPTDHAALTEVSAGRGTAMLIAPDLTGAIVRIQQGTAVTRDGVPAPDGTSPVCDGALKSDDGAVLDWHFDRQEVRGVPGYRAFLQPVADHWRELLLRSIFYLASRHEVSLPLLWLYPRNLPALAHMSNDTDGNDADKARNTIRLLEQAGVKSTWCVLTPGYGADVAAEVREAGHELGMHYDAMSEECPWSEEQFDAQWRRLVELFGEQPVSNKNHYLRWEGDTEFFEWCVRRGIKLDQSKGASKTGEAGFNFGTCHPHFPVDPTGAPIDVLELPTLTQDLVIFAPPDLAEPLLDSAVRCHGILHVLFHPAHTQTPGVAEALLSVAARAREQGMEWWTAKQISAWERARRRVVWGAWRESEDEVSVELRASDPMRDATLIWLAVGTASGQGRRVCRWGFEFVSQVIDLEAGRPCRFGCSRASGERE